MMRKTVYIISVLGLILCMTTCTQPADPDKPLISREYWQPIIFDPEEIEIDGDLGSFTASWAKEEIENDLLVLTLTLKSPRPAAPPPFSIEWSFPSVDIHAFWNANVDVDKHYYYKNRVSSKAASQAPVLAFLNNRDQNRFTFACSDALNQLNLNSYIREEDARFYCSVQLFGEKTPAMSEYTLRLRIDKRQIPFYVALQEVSDWWGAQENYTPAPVPDSARMPMYSTWYSFHQNITADEVVNECRLAKDMGFEAVIVEDGWQTLDSQRGYAYTGDWKPERIPDIMIEFRQRYIGPLMRKYGNMFRAVDCPNMAAINRARTTDIRLLCGNTAPHSDMFMWHEDEPVEAAALQVLNILFSVPQLSVRLNRIPDDHIQMIKFWIGYWKKNRNVLLDGKFMPVNPGAVYPLIRAETDEKVIVAVYNDVFVSVDPENQKNWDIVNAKPGETVILDIGQPLGDVRLAVFDCKGNLISDEAFRLDKGVYKFAVPPSGLLAISK